MGHDPPLVVVAEPEEDETPDEEETPDEDDVPAGEEAPDEEPVPADDEVAALFDVRCSIDVETWENLAPMTAAAAADSRPTRQVIFLTRRWPSSRESRAAESAPSEGADSTR